jgi:hypothetical protein
MLSVSSTFACSNCVAQGSDTASDERDDDAATN